MRKFLGGDAWPCHTPPTKCAFKHSRRVVEAVRPFKRDVIEAKGGQDPFNRLGLADEAVDAAHNQGFARRIATLQHHIVGKARFRRDDDPPQTQHRLRQAPPHFCI